VVHPGAAALSAVAGPLRVAVGVVAVPPGVVAVRAVLGPLGIVVAWLPLELAVLPEGVVGPL
jgi:hypothetical protein